MTPEQQARKSAGGTGRLAPRTIKQRVAAGRLNIELPKHWRRLPTSGLEAWAAANPDHPGVEQVLLELDDRDQQAAANRGEMNGLAPESDLP